MNSASSAAAPRIAIRSVRARPRTTSPTWPQTVIDRTAATDVMAISRPICSVPNPRLERMTAANGPNAATAMPLSTNSSRMRAIR